MRYPERSVGSQAPATIFREARRLVAMINAYLEVLRLDVGARPIRVTPVDIVAVAKHVEQIVQPLAQTARIQLRVENATQVRMLECDENLVSGALLNLLSNAVKYSPAESDVVLRLAANGESMELAVHNTGTSIPPPSSTPTCERRRSLFLHVLIDHELVRIRGNSHLAYIWSVQSNDDEQHHGKKP